MKHQLKILGSVCNINNMYLDHVKKMAESMAIDFEIEKILDENEIESYGVSVNCAFGICPGCHQNNAGSSEKHTPALVINEALIFHSKVPEDEKLRKVLEKLKKKN